MGGSSSSSPKREVTGWRKELEFPEVAFEDGVDEDVSTIQTGMRKEDGYWPKRVSIYTPWAM